MDLAYRVGIEKLGYLSASVIEFHVKNLLVTTRYLPLYDSSIAATATIFIPQK